MKNALSITGGPGQDMQPNLGESKISGDSHCMFEVYKKDKDH